MSEPDPSQVLKEAEAAAKAGRYEEALKKHVWYHENALRLQPSEAGVHLSFALLAWYLLARVYPPALSKLHEIRDATLKRVYEEDTDADGFSDLVSLNELLGEPEKTVELFRWLDAKKPHAARFAYFFGREVLVEQGEYELCGKYVTVPDDFDSAVSAYEVESQIVESHVTEGPPAEYEMVRGFAPLSFSHNVCFLVALLVLNNRKSEAVKYAAKAKEFLDEPEFHAKLEIALEGTAPERMVPINPKYWEKYLGEM
jgi:hypothetical protein